MHPLDFFRDMSSTVPAAACFVCCWRCFWWPHRSRKELKHRPPASHQHVYLLRFGYVYLLSYELSGGHEPTRIAARLFPGSGSSAPARFCTHAAWSTASPRLRPCS